MSSVALANSTGQLPEVPPPITPVNNESGQDSDQADHAPNQSEFQEHQDSKDHKDSHNESNSGSAKQDNENLRQVEVKPEPSQQGESPSSGNSHDQPDQHDQNGTEDHERSASASSAAATGTGASASGSASASASVSPSPRNESPSGASPSASQELTPKSQSGTSSSSNDADTRLHRRHAPQIQVRPGSTICQNCFTTTTPLWRRDESGQIMCNACGLFLKLHGRRRPISLKTDVIKSRNRGNRQNRMDKHNASKKKQMAAPVVIQTVHSQTLAIRQAQQAEQEVQMEAERQLRLQYRNGTRVPPSAKSPSSGSVGMNGVSSGADGGEGGEHGSRSGNSPPLRRFHYHRTPSALEGQQQQPPQASHVQQPPQGPLPGQIPGQPQQQQQQPQQAHPQQQPQPGQQPVHIPGMPPHMIPHPMGGIPHIQTSMGTVPFIYPGAHYLSPSLNPTHMPPGMNGVPPPGIVVNSPVLDPHTGQFKHDPRIIQPSPLAMAPLGQPMSPQIIAQTGGGPMLANRMPTRGAVSELLLPHSPELTDRIPHLAQVPVSQFQQSEQQQQQQQQQSQSQPQQVQTPQSRPQQAQNHTPQSLQPPHQFGSPRDASPRGASQRGSPSMHDRYSPRGAVGESPAESPAQPLTESVQSAPSSTTNHSSSSAEKDNNQSLLIKVSELELVNDLLRRRISDLEASEAQAKRHVEEMRAAICEMQGQKSQQPQQPQHPQQPQTQPAVVPESNSVKHEEHNAETEKSSHHEAPQPPVSPASKRLKVSELI